MRQCEIVFQVAINPKEEIDKLFASLGMSVSQDVYYYILSSSKSKHSSSHGFDVIKNSKDVYDRWTREMDPEMMIIVTEQCSDFLDYFNYPKTIL